MSEPVLSVRELETHLYSREGTIRPVNSVSFDIQQGETLGIVGESGSGKTMTALSIMGLIPKNLGGVVGGSVLLDGEDLAKMSDSEVRRRRSTKMGMIFQDPATSLNPTMKVGPQIAETMKTHLGINDTTARNRTIELLDRVGIPSPEGRYNNYPFQFSGGMRQRVMIAIALSCDPLLLIADEPTTALDVTIQAQLLDFVREIKEERGMSVMWITHDLGVVAELCDQVAVMYAGVDCGEGVYRRHLRAAQAPVHVDAAQLHALDCREDGGTADVDQRAPSQSREPAGGVSIRGAVQLAGGTLHRRTPYPPVGRR